jgi:hypothetical protein
MDIYFNEGIPAGSDVVKSAVLSLTPNLFEIYPNIGSIGGTELTVTAPGLGSSDVATLVNSTGFDIC